MKFLSVVALLTLSLNTFAKAPIATCSTVGDALDSVELMASKGGQISEVRINSMDPNKSKSYKVSKELSAMASRTSISLIAAQNLEDVYGGAIFNAIKLDIDAKLTRGVLAADGAVFFLNCHK
jgi:hypothetical protein